MLDTVCNYIIKQYEECNVANLDALHFLNDCERLMVGTQWQLATVVVNHN